MNNRRICNLFVVWCLVAGVGGGFLAWAFPVASYAADDLPAPSIAVNPDVYYPLEEVLYLEGMAQSNSAVQIQFQKQGARPLSFSVRSDSRGEWVLAEKVPLEAGEWEVRARLSENSERVSEWSNPRVFRVVVTGITIGGVNITFAALVLAIVILVVIGAIVIVYLTGRVRRLRGALVSKEIREARDAVTSGFAELRKDLTEEVRRLDSSGALGAEERSRREHLLREIEQLEYAMEREIRDIEEKM